MKIIKKIVNWEEKNRKIEKEIVKKKNDYKEAASNLLDSDCM